MTTWNAIQIGRYSFLQDRTDYSKVHVLRERLSEGFTILQVSGKVLIQHGTVQWSCEVPAYDIDLTFNRTARFLVQYQSKKKQLFPESEAVTGCYPPSDGFFFRDYEGENVFVVKGRYIWIMNRTSGDILRYDRARFIQREEFVKTLFDIDGEGALTTHEDILYELEPV